MSTLEKIASSKLYKRPYKIEEILDFEKISLPIKNLGENNENSKFHFGFNLPSTQSLSILHSYELEEEFKEVYDFMGEFFKKYLVTFNSFELKNYKIQLPPTKFGICKTIPVFREPTYEAERLMVDKLNSIQRCEIFLEGKFRVNSQKYGMDYVWRMNPWIIYGSRNLFKKISLFAHKALESLQKLPNFLYFDEKYGKYPTIFHGSKIFVLFLWNIVDLFIGRPRNHIYHDETKYHEIIAKEWYSRLFQQKNNLPINFLIKWQKKHKINLYDGTPDIFESFNKIWEEKFRATITAECNEKCENDLEANNYYLDKMMTEFSKFIQNLRDLDNVQQKNLINLFKFYLIIIPINEEYQNELIKNIREIEKSIRQKHSFLQRFPCFIDPIIKKETDKVKDQIFASYSQKTIESLKKQPLQNLFESFSNFREVFLSRHHQLRIESELHPIENKVFYFSRNFFPPWEIKKTEVQNARPYYSFILYKTYKFTSNEWFWRFHYFIVQYYVFSWNLMFHFLGFSLRGPLSFRTLFCLDKYHSNVYCESTTGVVRKGIEFHSVTTAFKIVLTKVSNVRENFERQPDTGFFGKNFWRLFNLFYAYIVIFLIIGVFGVLIAFSLLSLTMAVLTFVLSLTAYFYSPILLLIAYLFNILIYDRLSANSRYGDRYEVSRFLPLFQEIFKLAYYGVGQILLAIASMVLLPFIALIQFLYPYVFCIIRFILDCLFFVSVWLLGRVPAKDSGIAWRVSGPGVSRRNVCRISLEHASIFLQSYLEQVELNRFKAELTQLLNSPNSRNRRVLGLFFKPLGVSPSIKEINSIQKKIDKKMQEFQKLLQNRFNVFPQLYNSNIRFSYEELQNFKNLAKAMINEYLSENRLDYIWDIKQVERQKLDSLVDLITAELFGSGSLEPLEDLDERVELEINASEDFDHLVALLNSQSGAFQEILKTQVRLKEVRQKEINLSKLKKKNFYISKPYEYFNYMKTLLTNSVYSNFFFDLPNAGNLDAEIIEKLKET